MATAGGLLLIGLVLLVPDLARSAETGRDVVTAFRGRIVEIQQARSDPDAAPVPIARVLALDGEQVGVTMEAYLVGPGGAQVVADYRVGDEVVVTITQSPDSSSPFVAVSDRWRIPYLQWLGIFFAVVVLLVGGWRGARALIALGLTIAVILKILLPLVINGVAPLPLAVFAASGVTVAAILLTEGWRRSSLSAILGTTGALAITGLLGAGVTAVMGFTYTAGSDLAFIITEGGLGLDLRGLLLAAFILGAVGVLDDVTVTQAALVEELADKGQLRGRGLFVSAMGVGRSHIGATINTLFLAYVGAGLPLLVLLLVSRQPSALILNAEPIATEIVRTLVGSIGIVAAVPFTTFVASLLASASAEERVPGAPDRRRRAVAAISASVIALLAATTLLPLTSGAGTPLPPTVLDPGASFPAGSGDPRPAESFPAPPPAGPVAPGDPQLAERGQPLPVIVDGREMGTVTVTGWTIAPQAPPKVGTLIRVSLRYQSFDAFDLTRVGWEILLADGTEWPLEPKDLTSIEGSLAAGEDRAIDVVGEMPEADETPFLIYLDRATGALVYAIALE